MSRPPTEEQRQRARDRARQWRLDNPERAAANARKSAKAWIERNPDRARELHNLSQRRRRAADPEKFRAYQRAWYARHREQVLQRIQQNHRDNPELYRERVREDARRRKRADPQGESDRFRRMKMARLHGMKPEDWAALWDAQGGRCYLCGCDLSALPSSQVHVEHDHRCCPRETSCGYCRRGLACMRCNTIIGLARDDPVLLRTIASNLEPAIALTDQRLHTRPEQLTLEALPTPRLAAG